MKKFLPKHLKNLLRPFFYTHVVGSRVLQIENRHRADPIGHVTPHDFAYRAGRRIDAKNVLENPNISLYCFDDRRKQAIFVETPPEVDLLRYPFLYPAQFEHAQRLIAVPYRAFKKLAADMDHRGEDLILIYSVGRCGSTLVSQLFKQIEGMLSLSEPDAFTNLVKMREPDGSRDDELRHLLRSTIKVLAQPLGEHRPTRWAIKFRSFHIELSDLIHDVFPRAKIIFLYRNAEARIQSMARAFNLLQQPAQEMTPAQLQANAYIIPSMRQYADKARDGQLTPLEISTLGWLSGMEGYMALYRRNVPIFSARYEDMIAYPRQFTAALLDFCEISPEFVEAAAGVFNRDSQKGTRLAKATLGEDTGNQLQEEHLHLIRNILGDHPLIREADYHLPGTWQPG